MAFLTRFRFRSSFAVSTLVTWSSLGLGSGWGISKVVVRGRVKVKIRVRLYKVSNLRVYVTVTGFLELPYQVLQLIVNPILNQNLYDYESP